MACRGESNFVNKMLIEKQIEDDRKLEKVEASLAKARALIKEALLLRTNATVLQDDTSDYIPEGDIYRNAVAFHRYEIYIKQYKYYAEDFSKSELF